MGGGDNPMNVGVFDGLNLHKFGQHHIVHDEVELVQMQVEEAMAAPWMNTEANAKMSVIADDLDPHPFIHPALVQKQSSPTCSIRETPRQSQQLAFGFGDRRLSGMSGQISCLSDDFVGVGGNGSGILF